MGSKNVVPPGSQFSFLANYVSENLMPGWTGWPQQAGAPCIAKDLKMHWHFFYANKKLQQALSDSHGKRHTLLDCLTDFAQGKAWYVIFLAFMYANRSHVSSSLALWLRDGPFQLVIFAPK
jgi:hypothetical protein